MAETREGKPSFFLGSNCGWHDYGSRSSSISFSSCTFFSLFCVCLRLCPLVQFEQLIEKNLSFERSLASSSFSFCFFFFHWTLRTCPPLPSAVSCVYINREERAPAYTTLHLVHEEEEETRRTHWKANLLALFSLALPLTPSSSHSDDDVLSLCRQRAKRGGKRKWPRCD